TSPRPQLSPVAIVDIDDRSLKEEGHWPWSRRKLATLVDSLQNQQVLAIVFDIIFSENEPNVAETLLTDLNRMPPVAPACAVGFLKQNVHLFDQDIIFAKSLLNANAILA